MKSSLIRFLSAVVLAVAACTVSAPRAHAQASEFFDAFFSDNAGQPQQNFKGFIQWTVSDPPGTTVAGSASVDFVGGNTLGAFNYPQGRFVDLGGSTGLPGVFSTKAPIVLTPGVSYTLLLRCASTEALLALGGVGSNTLLDPTPDGPLDRAVATIGGQTLMFSSSSASFQNLAIDFVAQDTGGVLSLRDLGFTDPNTGQVRYDNSGLGVDVVLFAPTAAIPALLPLVPEPSTYAMMGIGVAALVGWYIRRARLKA